MKKKVFSILWKIIGVLYFPIYVLAWLLHKITRFLLAISYFGLLQPKTGKDILKYMFNR